MSAIRDFDVRRGAMERGLRRPTEDALSAAERRAAARRFASFQDQEASALLMAARSAVTGPRARGLSDLSWLALVGLNRELEVEVQARLRREAQ